MVRLLSFLMEEFSQNRWQMMSELITAELPFGKLLRDILKISNAPLSRPQENQRKLTVYIVISLGDFSNKCINEELFLFMGSS